MSNRATRRAMRAKAREAADRAAARTYDFDTDGHLSRVTDARAVGVLRRAFALTIRAGGQPVAMQITEAEAAAFPRHDPIAGGAYVLAAGVDAAGRGTYAIQACAIGVCGETIPSKAVPLAIELAKARAMHRLTRLTATAGFPITHTEGQA